MRKKNIPVLVIVLSICISSFGQTGPVLPLRTFKVAIFAPLYLDSIFDDGNYKYGKNFPRFVTAGLDFVQGAEIALDSMPLPNGNIQATVYDSKSVTDDIKSLITKRTLDSFHLIIGSVKDEEYTELASFASSKHIPFISATYPNDGGVTHNPYLAIINSTLKAHCEAIYSFALQNHGTDKIILARKAGIQEEKVAGYFSVMNQPDGKPLLSIQTIRIDSNFNLIKSSLDSNRQNIIIGGSLDEEFAYNLATAAKSWNKKYDITLIGMPNWNAFPSFTNTKKTGITGFPVFFTAPYYNNKSDNYSRMIQDVYLKKYKGKPSDNTYKGFETVFVFARLLTRYPEDFMNHLNDYAYKVFSEYNFKPVYNSRNSTTPDYFENKRLNFLRCENGITSKAW